MNKTYMFSAVGAGIAAATVVGTAVARSKKKQNEQTVEDTLNEAGLPDQTNHRDWAQKENAKMVSEGSQFGVQYFNNVKNMPKE
ncbi:hypothetical protein JNUCC1_00060 [Lentibacillus sp. JNUCC-1]|uniref:hypothetical protein n=1 Tax=Lentibacillus sp. JNUCC-1 TaxID=2654513 RepID=UPI0012E90D6A|nr:hypothetical protein [Lentibacillus sp. JNUCC-1]MUV36259.1 hypothetical protein [Lentibacillus sp. JNUCC-1]